MRCKSCGGTLVYSDGSYLCEYCGSQFPAIEHHEDIDAYICYIEADEAGRRTKDSILAQDIYRTLERAKIKTFYARVSADRLSGAALEEACNAALLSAKTVLILGTQTRYFEAIVEKYSALWAGKVLIPVYADMNAYDIPRGISAIQALDYSRVGAGVDLVKGIHNALGRKQEQDYTAPNQKAKPGKKVVLWIGTVLLLITAITVGIYCYIDGNTPDTTPEIEEIQPTLSPEQTQENQYNEAMACVESGDYVRAIELFAELSGYRDRDKQVAIIYQRYAGYYQNKEQNISFRIQVWEENVCGVEVTKKTLNGVCTISEVFQLGGVSQTIAFSDSENNQGEITVEFGNEGVIVNIRTTDVSSTVFISDTKVTFLLGEKTDKPISSSLDAKTLQDMVRGKTTLGQLRRQGFELEFHENEKNTISTEYRIKNTDIVFAFSWQDPNTLDPVEDPVVVAISAPANIIIPNKIGKQNDPFEKDHIIYVPDGEFCGDVGIGLIFGFSEDIADEFLAGKGKIIARSTIKSDTLVCFTGTNTPATSYDKLYNRYINAGAREDLYMPEATPEPTPEPIPKPSSLDAKTLRDMVRGKTTLSQLRRQGFELESHENERNTISAEYRIKNTDIVFAFSWQDPNTLDPVEDPVVVAISAPASIIIPDKIGKQNDPFEKDHIIYVPDGEFCGDVGIGLIFGFPEDIADEFLAGIGKIIARSTIKSDTLVCFTGTNTPATSYDNLYNRYINAGAREDLYMPEATPEPTPEPTPKPTVAPTPVTTPETTSAPTPIDTPIFDDELSIPEDTPASEG